MNSIIGSLTAESAPDAKDWAQLQKRLNSDKKIKELDKKIKESDKNSKKLEQRIKLLEYVDKMTVTVIKKLEERIEKLESKNAQKEKDLVNTQNLLLISNTAQKPNWQDKTSAPKMGNK